MAPWAETVISKLGNGQPAFHFLMVGRPSLGGVNYSRRILEGVPADRLIESGLRSLDTEYP